MATGELYFRDLLGVRTLRFRDSGDTERTIQDRAVGTLGIESPVPPRSIVVGDEILLGNWGTDAAKTRTMVLAWWRASTATWTYASVAGDYSGKASGLRVSGTQLQTFIGGAWRDITRTI